MVSRMDAEANARALLARAQQRRFALPERGVEIAALDWGGSGPIALLHHANGFCKGVWGLVADALRDRWRVVAVDGRGHGDSSKPEDAAAYEWQNFAEDLAAVADRLHAESGAPIALGIGNSFGGTSLIGAAARRPGRFQRLLLLDPVTPVPVPAGVDLSQSPHFRRLIEGAQRRRTHWDSRAAARAWCAERSLFKGWRPEAIELYLLDGMRERADGSLELKCPGAVEAAVFGAGPRIDILALSRQVDCPTLFLWAEQGDFSREFYQTIAAGMRDARVETLACGHLVPMQCPELVLDAVERW
jgi:pimeloyl-ACP methyl ester carboxylesterase